MPLIFRKYGDIIEITEYEKSPSKVRVPFARERHDVFEARRPDNIRRTRKICVWRVSTALALLGCPLLVTLTFKGDASDASYANDALRAFQVRLRTAYPDARSLFVPELSPKGRIHFHGLIFNVPLSLGDTREGKRTILYGDERKTRVLAKLWGEGYVDATKTDGSRRLAYYISKYITKGSGNDLFNAMRILRISHDFPKEIILRGEVAETEAKKYADLKPVSEWNGETKFQGKISKKTYEI